MYNRRALRQTWGRGRRKYRRRNKFGIRRFPYKPMIRRGLNRMELKFEDKIIASPQVPSSGILILMNGLDEGISANERIGQAVCNKAIMIKMAMTPVQASTTTTVYSVDIIWDRQPNGALPLITEVWLTVEPFGFRNLQNRQRFKTLYSSGPFVLGEANSNNQADSVAWNVFIKCQAETTYSGITDLIGSISTGSILLSIRTDAALLTTHKFDAISRIRYNDGQAGGQANISFKNAKVVGGGSVLGGYKRG